MPRIDRAPRPAVWLALLALIGLAQPLRSRADSVSLTPVRDNTLFEDAAGTLSNGAGTGIFAGRTSQGLIRRALILFDPTGALPADATLDSVALVLNQSNTPSIVPRAIEVHRALADWGEGTSVSTGGGGAAATAGDATWIHRFYPVDPWSAPGGDFDPTASATVTVTGNGVYAWSSTMLTSDVAAWLAQPAQNHGWVLVGDEAANSTARRFDSREITTPATRPRLVLYYSPMTPVVRSSWGRIKNLYR